VGETVELTARVTGLPDRFGGWAELTPRLQTTAELVRIRVDSADPNERIEVQIGTGRPGAETPIMRVPYRPGVQASLISATVNDRLVVRAWGLGEHSITVTVRPRP
jgi:hypothetical protein